MGWPEPAGHDHVREVRSALALNREAERYALEGVPIALSTMADAVGSVCTALDPLLRLVEAHVMASVRVEQRSFNHFAGAPGQFR